MPGAFWNQGTSPRHMCRSEPQIVASAMRTSTSPGPGSGTARWRTSMRGELPSTVTAARPVASDTTRPPPARSRQVKPAAAQRSLASNDLGDAPFEDLDSKRLGEEAFDAQGFHRAWHRTGGRDDDDGNCLPTCVVAIPFDEVPAVEHWHHQIEHDGI